MRLSMRGVQMAAPARIRSLLLARPAEQPLRDAFRNSKVVKSQGPTARADDKPESTVDDLRGVSEDASPDSTLGLLR
jgi:hypothetical protein